MATQSWTTRLRHDSDAEFRLWGSEFETKLQAAGLIKTSDTGQINWVTVVRAGTNSDAGYAIYYLNDSLHATAPLYIKFLFGTNGSTSGYRLRIQLGEGSDGAGNLTGSTTTIRIANQSGDGTNTAVVNTTWPSYLCVTEGFAGLAYKLGSTGTAGGFTISRTCDPTDGALTTVGAMLFADENAQYLDFAGTLTAGANAVANFGCMPYNFTTLGSGDTPIGFTWEYKASANPVYGVIVHPSGTPAANSTFTAEIFPGLTQTFLAVSSGFTTQTNFLGPPCGGTSTLQCGLLWE